MNNGGAINVLIFEPYPFGQVSGNLKTLSYILRFSNRAKFKVMLVTPFESEFTSKVKKEGFGCTVLMPPKRLNRYGGKCLNDSLLGKFRSMLDLVRYNLNLLFEINEKRIDVIYCNSIRSVLSVAIAAKLSRRPILWYIKGELQNKILDTIGFSLANRILFQCESNKNDKYPLLVRRYKHKIAILPNAIDHAEIEQAERREKEHWVKELSIDDGKVNIIYLGQLQPQKGVQYLLEALVLVIREFPNTRLYIVGDYIIDEFKEYRDKLMDIVERNRLGEYVYFTGWRSDGLNILSIMDILVHPSLTEGMPRAVMEAMGLGKAVVATGVGGIRELIKDGENGFLVNPRDIEGLARKLLILLGDKELRDKLGQAARKVIFSGYIVQDRIGQLEQIWRDMVRGR